MALVLFLKQVFKLLADRTHTRMIVVFVCLTDYSLHTAVIRLCRNFRDCFGGSLSFRNYEN